MSTTAETQAMTTQPAKAKLTPSEISRLGGLAAHAKGTAHKFTPAEAREAGRKGGLTVSQNREHMAAIGRIGGSKK